MLRMHKCRHLRLDTVCQSQYLVLHGNRSITSPMVCVRSGALEVKIDKIWDSVSDSTLSATDLEANL